VEGSIIKLQGDGQETDGGTQLPHGFFYKKTKQGMITSLTRHGKQVSFVVSHIQNPI
jgi:predicted ester cyclase